MKITLELLDKYGIEKKYIEENGLDGADLMKIMDRSDVPIEFLHSLKKYLKFDESEKSAYNRICKVDDASRNVWNSQQVERSTNLMNAYFVKDSTNVRNSMGVSNSNFVYKSDSVANSNEVVRSEVVNDSDIVMDSKFVSVSERVARSTNIEWCESVFLSNNLNDCKFIYQSENLSDSYFCGFVKNSSHCMFCTGLEDEEYCIFNEKVDPQVFSQWVDELRERLDAEQSLMIEVNENGFSAEERFDFNPRFDSVFRGLSKEFYGWIGTLPNFTEDKFLNLFFNESENLKNS